LKSNKAVIISFSLFLISLLWSFVYPIISDVVLGDTKELINNMVSPYLKPMSARGYIPLILLLIAVIFQAYQLFLDKEELENKVTRLEEEKEQLEKRLKTYIDKSVLKPSIHIVSNRKEDKLAFIKSKMEAFVSREPYVKGIQLYEYSLSTNKVHIKRVVEFVDDVSSWDSVTLNFRPNLLQEFHKAIQRGEEKEFIKKCEYEINSLNVNDISEHNIFQFALMNVAIHLLSDKKIKVFPRINYNIKREMYKRNKRIGIIEAIVYITYTGSENYYIFEKKYGDAEKVGRYYFTLPYTINNEPHIMLITFDKVIKEINEANDVVHVLSEKVEKLLNTLEN
jgi:hypothetical protein